MPEKSDRDDIIKCSSIRSLKLSMVCTQGKKNYRCTVGPMPTVDIQLTATISLSFVPWCHTAVDIRNNRVKRVKQVHYNTGCLLPQSGPVNNAHCSFLIVSICLNGVVIKNKRSRKTFTFAHIYTLDPVTLDTYVFVDMY